MDSIRHATESCTIVEPQQSHLLSLPPELRNRIYDFLLTHDVESFADTAHLPDLLQTNAQIREEYSGIFFTATLIKVNAYYSATDSWCEISDRRAKQSILAHAVFRDLIDFWSLASARRYCQRQCHSRENVQRGIVAVATNAGFRRWQWSVRCE